MSRIEEKSRINLGPMTMAAVAFMFTLTFLLFTCGFLVTKVANATPFKDDVSATAKSDADADARATSRADADADAKSTSIAGGGDASARATGGDASARTGDSVSGATAKQTQGQRQGQDQSQSQLASQSTSTSTDVGTSQSLTFSPSSNTRVEAEPTIPVATADAPRGTGGSLQFPDSAGSLRPPDRFQNYLDLADRYDAALRLARAEYLRALQTRGVVKGQLLNPEGLIPFEAEVERLTALRDEALRDARRTNERGCNIVSRTFGELPIVGFLVGNGC